MTIHQFPRTSIALIVDDDLGLVFWLATLFTESGCQAIPALNCQEALSVMRQLNLKPDLVAVNLELAGVSKMIQTLSCSERRPKIIAIGLSDMDARSAIPVEGTLKRPSGREHISHHEWLDRVRSILDDVRATGGN